MVFFIVSPLILVRALPASTHPHQAKIKRPERDFRHQRWWNSHPTTWLLKGKAFAIAAFLSFRTVLKINVFNRCSSVTYDQIRLVVIGIWYRTTHLRTRDLPLEKVPDR
jgi:hypothetical protein